MRVSGQGSPALRGCGAGRCSARLFGRASLGFAPREARGRRDRQRKRQSCWFIGNAADGNGGGEKTLVRGGVAGNVPKSHPQNSQQPSPGLKPTFLPPPFPLPPFP